MDDIVLLNLFFWAGCLRLAGQRGVVQKLARAKSFIGTVGRIIWLSLCMQRPNRSDVSSSWMDQSKSQKSETLTSQWEAYADPSWSLLGCATFGLQGILEYGTRVFMERQGNYFLSCSEGKCKSGVVYRLVLNPIGNIRKPDLKPIKTCFFFSLAFL